ncbi:MAG: hydroxyacid dehydrogenase [Deltaproteobacteria bacterium]|nr:hydroxyacid dehydrogenase [Deltaproteobacteria bacterium]
MNAPIKVLLTEAIDEEALALLERKARVEFLDDLTKEKLLERMGNVDILFNKTDASMVDRDVIRAGKRLRLIARHGSGYSNVDVQYATEKGIPITYTPGVNAHSVAEYTFGLLLMLAKKMLPAIEAARKGMPDRRKFRGVELYGKTFGIIGVGSIGREVVKRALAFGMKVLAYHPRPSASRLSDLDLKLVSLEELLIASDVVSFHASLTPETTRLLGKREFSMMKKSAFFLNLGRGENIDEDALVEALKHKMIAGAAVDVVLEEPVRKENPLLALDNAVVLPHIASMTPEAQKRTAMTAVEDIIRFINGQRSRFMVNPEAFANRADEN